MNRHKAREKAFQTLFQIGLEYDQAEEAVKTALNQEEADPFLLTLAEGTVSHIVPIDQLIEQNLQSWSLGRIAAVERAVLRLAVFELEYMDDIPENVTINEAIELAKTYGDEKSGKFVNGVLSNIVKDQQDN
ncbi:transcription antitermination factor NusB [Virgibacillus halophilus]|uniref:Transcription antitermination protein NusB n=1 Tax=Tigheibacillus halophilus TaxID=361280 RepID=A0ABU5CAX8_9BACI|nr:transcription antitermination factor NusB [Virgibacillus halophilus]